MKLASLLLGLTTIVGCAQTAPPAKIVSITSGEMPTTAAAPMAGPRVPAGSKLALRLDKAIGTDLSEPGDWFTATVTRSVYNGKGDELLIPTGAQVRGRVVRADGGKSPTLALELESIETMRGVMQLDAAISNVSSTMVDAPSPHRTTASPYADEPGVVAYSTTVSPWEPSGNESGPPLERQIRIPAGAALELVLTQPLIVTAKK